MPPTLGGDSVPHQAASLSYLSIRQAEKIVGFFSSKRERERFSELAYAVCIRIMWAPRPGR